MATLFDDPKYLYENEPLFRSLVEAMRSLRREKFLTFEQMKVALDLAEKMAHEEAKERIRRADGTNKDAQRSGPLH